MVCQNKSHHTVLMTISAQHHVETDVSVQNNPQLILTGPFFQCQYGTLIGWDTHSYLYRRFLDRDLDLLLEREEERDLDRDLDRLRDFEDDFKDLDITSTSNKLPRKNGGESCN